jgi:hypothetical protein
MPQTIDSPPGITFEAFITRLLMRKPLLLVERARNRPGNDHRWGVIDFDRALRPLQRREPRMKTKTNVKAGIIVVC